MKHYEVQHYYGACPIIVSNDAHTDHHYSITLTWEVDQLEYGHLQYQGQVPYK